MTRSLKQVLATESLDDAEREDVLDEDIEGHAIREKVRIMVEHFHQNVAHRINGRAKAMIVTRSRLHAVRYHRALERYLTEQSYDHGALVAFSGTVRDGGIDHTEANLNGIPETQTKDAFERAGNRFLVVANNRP